MLQFIKIGTGCIINETGAINYQSLRNKVKEIDEYWNKNSIESAIVVSGAIALGKIRFNETRNNADISALELQSYATVGQMDLMKLYSDISRRTVAQILVTEADIANPNDVAEVLKHNAGRGILTLINYNDGIVADELRKDNDTIAAKLVVMTNASRLVILGSNYYGFHGTDGKLIERVYHITDEMYHACNGKSHHGNGGFKTKLDAARFLMQNGKHMIVGNMRYKLEELIDGRSARTLFEK